jgi:2-amino-4-hydroxy-6-hydroxymethyldihydropteridine diphosphokinase
MIVYLALGSNIGDRESHLKGAIRGLSNRGIEIMQSASIYSTEPKDVEDQPWFLNTIIKINTSLQPGELLETCLAVEKENARVRDGIKGPRTLDIDIIFYGMQVIRGPDLVVPHPRFRERRFVLEPLAEIAPDFVDPSSGKAVRQLLQETLDNTKVYRIDVPLL